MWLPKEGNFILLFSNKISESGISAWATTRDRPYEIIFMRLNDNLTVCFLLGHPGKPLPESYPGSGVATRQTIIYRRLTIKMNPTVTVNYSFFILQYSVFIQARSAASCKAAGCGAAAHFPCPKRGK